MTRLTLPQYVTTLHDWFTIDKTNDNLMEVLSQYCRGSDSFEKNKEFVFGDQKQLFLEKGILLLGPVGVGKTELLRLISSYFGYIGKTEFTFRVANIPDIADNFSIKGREAFRYVNAGNWMFDELCFLDERTGKPDREVAINYGDKILIGSKIIYDRYNIFKETGWKSHFTSNANLKQIKELYGERAFSRLIEMCNVFMYTGADRRKTVRPHFRKNFNNATVKEVVGEKVAPPAVLTPDQELSELQESYNAFLRNGNYLFIGPHEYEALRRMDFPVLDCGMYMEMLRAEYPASDDVRLEGIARQKAVADFYNSMKMRGESHLQTIK